MAFITADRVQETTVTSGTGAVALAGAAAGFRAFSAVCAVGDTVEYTIADPTAGAWEVGLGTYSAASTLTRTTVYASSNAGSAVALAGNAGTLVFATLSAKRAALIGASPVRVTAAAADTPTSADFDGAVVCTNGSGVTVTANDLGGYRAYSILQAGAGQVTVAAGTGVTLVSDKATASYKTARQGAALTVLGNGSGTVFVLGNTA